MTISAASALASLRRHVALMLVLAAIGGTVGLVTCLLFPPKYTATASVLVTPADGSPYNSGSRPAEQPLLTERLMVTRSAVLRAAADALGQDRTEAELRRGVTVVIPPSTQVFRIHYTDRNASLARRGAQAIAEAYLRVRRETADDTRTARLASVDKERAAVQRSIDALAKKLASTKSNADKTSLQTQLDSLGQQLTALVTAAGEIRESPVDPGQVLQPAGAAKSGRIGRALQLVGAGMLAGAALGAGLGLARGAGRKGGTERDGVDEEQVLARIPAVAAGTPEPVVTGGDRGCDDAYRRLRTAITNATGSPAAVLLTAAGPVPAASSVALNLAASAVRAGFRVALVEALPTAGHEGPGMLLGLPAGLGLSDVLSGTATLNQAFLASEHGVHVLPAGTMPDVLATGASLIRPEEVLGELRGLFDLVVTVAEGPDSATGSALAGVVDGVLVVSTSDVTRPAEVRDVRRRLDALRARTLGVVVADRPYGEIAAGGPRQVDPGEIDPEVLFRPRRTTVEGRRR